MAECNIPASRGQFAPWCVFFLTFVQNVATRCRAGRCAAMYDGSINYSRRSLPPNTNDGGAWKVNDKTVCWTRVLFQSLARSFCPSRQLRFRGFSSLNYGETNTAALCNIPSAVSNECRGRGLTSSCKTFVPRACCGRAAGDQRLVYPFTIRG